MMAKTFIRLAFLVMVGAMVPTLADAQSSAGCRSSCAGILDRSNNLNSAAVQRRYNDCMASCSRRAQAESAYQSCMARTKRVGVDGRVKVDQAGVQRCRASYQAGR